VAKANNIRKRALEYAKKRQWDKALAEFERLVEVEQNNPNLFNEIGDLYLKLGQKREAFQSYHTAVDAYSRISLHNNAVAVCKKILRLNPGDQTVCGKLAMLRHRQGFQRDCETYALTFLGKIFEVGDAQAEQLKDLVVEITRSAGDAAEVLERSAEYLIQGEFHSDAGTVLDKLEQIYLSEGLTEQCELVRKRMDSIGYVSSSVPGQDLELEKLETVESHRSGYAGGQGGYDDAMDGGAGTSGFPGDESTASAQDYGTVELGMSPDADGTPAQAQPSAEFVTEPSPAPQQLPDVMQPSPELAGNNGNDAEFEQPAATGVESATPPDGVPQQEWVIPDPDGEPAETPAGEDFLTGASVGAGGIVGQLSSEVTADIDEEDHRSHYDLGMAYLEMNLLSEAIREFQFATNSSMYQIRSLEMIGRCFLEQNKPQLAIKQLTRGLSLVGSDDNDSLGIRYSLGVAYEMIGDIEKAREFFEDVYVVDVTFREVAEKMEELAP
jgi:tetratricopeptide (TPR) repeat protein